MIHVFTSAAVNYIGKVRALFHSVRRHHPEFVCHFLAAEDRRLTSHCLRLEDEPFHDIAYASDLPACATRGWAFAHTLVELATAIKPFYALELLQRDDCEAVIYLDPDIVVFSRLDDVVAALRRASIALTPHLVCPETTREGVLDNEICALKHGVFNLGFLGLSQSPEAVRFVEWWRDRAREYCVDDLAAGLFTDQKWIDLAPAFFDSVAVLRTDRLNVAPWNISQRRVSGSFEDGFSVGGKPLGFYHFTGFDSGAHEGMIQKYAPSNLTIKGLIDWYKRHTANLGRGTFPPWSFGAFDNGTPIAKIERRMYRLRTDLRDAFPDPFATNAAFCYYGWLRTQGVLEHDELARLYASEASVARTPPPHAAPEVGSARQRNDATVSTGRQSLSARS